MTFKNRFASAPLVLVVAAVLGCGGESRPPAGPLPPPTALTVEEWRTLPVQEKYDPTTYERLQMGDPALKQPTAWKKFETDVIGPEFKKDHPPS